MKVLVTGATGFVGRKIVRQLHEDGHAIRILVRNCASPRVQEAASRYGAEAYPGDVLEAASLNGALSGMDAVVASRWDYCRSRR
jgi:NADH dehydrogenase